MTDMNVKFRQFRPHYRFTPAISWQACCGHEPIGPVRELQSHAFQDLPPEAAAEMLPRDALATSECTTISCLEPYRLAPHLSTTLSAWAGSFKPRTRAV
jgi:hypothetical protein